MRKIGKSALKGYYEQALESRAISTNLEKKTQDKIKAMSTNDSLTMDFVLKNRKLLEHLKKCKVFLSKSMRNNLLRKYTVINNPINRHTHHSLLGKSKSGRPKKNVSGMLIGPWTNGEVILSSDEPLPTHMLKEPSPASHSNRVLLATSKLSKLSRTSSPLPKMAKTGKSSPPGRNVQSPGPIFIRLPQKSPKRTIQKRQLFTGTFDKTALVRKFGKMIFMCHVRVKRLRKSDPLFTKKFNTNRKTVSFMETVEVFGESDPSYESWESSDQSGELNKTANESPILPRTSTPVGKKKPVRPKTPLKTKTEKDIKKLKPELKTKSLLKSPSNVKKDPRKAKSPQKEKSPRKDKNQKKEESRSPKKTSPAKGSPQETTKKPRSSMTKKAIETAKRNLIDGKECFVKLNRNETSVLSSNSKDNVDEEGENVQHITEPEVNGMEIDEDSTVERSNGIAGEKDSKEDLVMAENEEQQQENGDDENILEPSIEKENNVETNEVENDEDDRSINLNVQKDNLEADSDDNIDEKSEKISQENLPSSEELADKLVLLYEAGNECGSDIFNLDTDLNQKETHENEVSSSQIDDQLNRKDNDNIDSSSANESFHSLNRGSPESQRRGRFDKVDRMLNASPGLSESKTNGTKKKNSMPVTLPESCEDLFDLLKSNKLPEPDSVGKRIPSPTPDLTDDEDPNSLERSIPSPVPDLLDESDSANDSRFSLNTFFKSMKDKVSGRLSGTGNNRSSNASSTLDDRHLKKPDTTHEITTQ